MTNFAIESDNDRLMNTLVDLSVVKDQIKQIDAQRTDLVARKVELESEANTIMTNNQIGRIEVNGRLFSPGERRYYSVNKEQQAKAFKFLEDNGLDWLIQESVNSRSLSSQLISRVAEGGDIPADLFNVRVDKTINMRNT